MKLDELSFSKGSKKSKKRLGRGIGSGKGKTSGKGHKGQNARSGGGVRPGFEGGQMPLHRRIPARGFNNIFSKRYAIVNVKDLEAFEDGAEVSVLTLLEAKKIKKEYDGLKILGNGDLSKRLIVTAAKFSKVAAKKIEDVGGKVNIG